MKTSLFAIAFALMILCLSWSPVRAETLSLAAGASPGGGGSSIRHAIKLDGGFGSPTGLGGLNYVLEPVSWFQLEVGLGVGLSGFVVSLMPKLSLGNRRHRFVAGVGMSMAMYPDEDIEDIEELFYWINADLAGYERRFDSGWFFAISGGLTVLVDHSDLESDSSQKKRIHGIPFPQGRLSFGYRF